MPTARQVRANRRDGALSTAPSVPQGKTISLTKRISRGRWARNAVRSPTTISRQPLATEIRKSDKTNPIPFLG
jgi:hypothetical protein